jgi:hypothetical protein
MKKIILLLSFLLANEYLAHGQNWQTVPANDTNWFVVNSKSKYAQQEMNG